jgi:hypothetical protein
MNSGKFRSTRSRRNFQPAWEPQNSPSVLPKVIAAASAGRFSRFSRTQVNSGSLGGQSPRNSRSCFRSRLLGIVVALSMIDGFGVVPKWNRLLNWLFHRMNPEYAIRLVLPHVMYALAISLFAVLVLNVFFSGKRRRRKKSPLF